MCLNTINSKIDDADLSKIDLSSTDFTKVKKRKKYRITIFRFIFHCSLTNTGRNIISSSTAQQKPATLAIFKIMQISPSFNSF